MIDLTFDEVIAIHDEIVGRMASPPAPLVHRDRLESALARSRHAAWYEEADLVRQAALLAVGVSQGQAFLDGNKRTAFATADVFLRVNGVEYRGDPLELARRLEAVAEAPAGTARDAQSAAFEAWLRAYATTTGPVD